jgi:hypothetical protein
VHLSVLYHNVVPLPPAKNQFAVPLNNNNNKTSQLSRALQKKVLGLERGPFSLVSTTEKLLDRKVAAPV